MTKIEEHFADYSCRLDSGEKAMEKLKEEVFAELCLLDKEQFEKTVSVYIIENPFWAISDLEELTKTFGPVFKRFLTEAEKVVDYTNTVKKELFIYMVSMNCEEVDIFMEKDAVGRNINEYSIASNFLKILIELEPDKAKSLISIVVDVYKIFIMNFNELQ